MQDRSSGEGKCCCWEQGRQVAVGFIGFGRCPPHPQLRHFNPHLLINILYLHSILHWCGAGLSVLWVAGSELGEECASTPAKTFAFANHYLIVLKSALNC